MLPFLEQAIAQCWEQSNPKWSALLSSWLIAVGVMRHQHLLRSEPVRLSRSTLHLWCEKGKQSSKRGGFPWTVPAHFANGFGWAAAMLQANRAVFSPDGSKWALPECQRRCQELFEGHVQDAKDLTSYSWRRMGPTIGQIGGLGPLELNALGDWEDRSSLPDPASMPVRYSGGKKATSMRVKHLVYQLGASLREHQSWDVITPSELEEAKAFVMPTVDRLVSQDMDTEWQGKLPAEQVQRAFKFSQAARASAAAAGASQMPAAINGKLLTKFMRNGTPLCADFQTDSCSRTPCPEQHLCAIVLQSGRACGSSHSAQTCYARRALTEERAAAKGLLPLAQEPAVPTEAPVEPSEEPQEEPDYDPPSETESEDLTVVAPAEAKAAPKPPSPLAGEIIKGIAPAAERPGCGACQPSSRASTCPAVSHRRNQVRDADNSSQLHSSHRGPAMGPSCDSARQVSPSTHAAVVASYGWEASLPVPQHHTSHRSPCRWRAFQSTRRAAGPSSRMRCCGNGRSRTPNGRGPFGGSCGLSSGSHCGAVRVCCCTASQADIAPRGEGPSAALSCCRSHGRRVRGG